MNRDNERQTAVILSVIGIIPVVWLALLIAPSVKGGLPEILPSLLTAFNNPLQRMSDKQLKSKMSSVPIWKKMNLTVEEASEYSGIGASKIKELSNSEDCPFVLWNGAKRLIKRKQFEEYLSSQYSL